MTTRRVRPSRLSRLGALSLVTLAALCADGCKLFKKSHPSGHLARTVGPEQYTEAYPDQTSPQWDEAMRAGSSIEHSFQTRDVGTLHLWLRYGCASADGAFRLTGNLGVNAPGRPPMTPVPVSVTAEGATLSGVPRGSFAPIVIHAPRSASAGGMETDGYVYLFDIEAPQQSSVTLTGSLRNESGSRCEVLTYEVWRD